MTNEELFDLLSFEDELESVQIISETELEGSAVFISAELSYPGEKMNVPFIHYEGKDWLFTPWDWQSLPAVFDESVIEDIVWRVNGTEQEAIMFEGLPMLAPWVDEINDPYKFRREQRKRLGRSLKEAREDLGLSLRDVEDKTGINKSVISRTEGGRANTTIDTFNELADFYGYRMDLVKK